MKHLRSIILGVAGAGAGYIIGVLMPGEIPAVANTAVASGSSRAVVQAPQGPRMSDAAVRALDALGTPKSLEDYANAPRLLGDLEARDFPLLMDAIIRMPANRRKELMTQVYRAWVARDPEAAKAWGAAIAAQIAVDGLSMMGDSPVRAIAEEWFRHFPEAALAFSKEHWPKLGATQALHNYIWGSRKENLPATFAIVQGFPAGMPRQRLMTTLFSNWVQTDFAKALEAAKQLPTGSERENAISQIAVQRGQRDPAQAFKIALEEGLDNPRLFTALGSEAGVSRGAETAKWMLENARELIPLAGPGMVSRWAQEEPAEAFAWALENGISIDSAPESENGVASSVQHWNAPMGVSIDAPISEAMQSKPKQTIAWLKSLPAGDERDKLVFAVVSSYRLPAEAVGLYAEVPDYLKPQAALALVRTNFMNQGAKAREWAGSLPPGLAQDAAWRAVGTWTISTLPIEFNDARALDLMREGAAITPWQPIEQRVENKTKIVDPVVKQRAFEVLMWEMLHNARGSEMRLKNREIFEKSNFPEEWKRPLRESVPK